MGDIISWITVHWVELGVVISAIHIIAKAICDLTPTPKDNEMLARIVIIAKKAIAIIGMQPGVYRRIA